MTVSFSISMLFFSVLSFSISTPAFSQEILVAPNSAVVFQNDTANFTCETRGGVSGWWINGIPFDLLPIDIRRELEESEHITNESSIVLTLTIPSRPEYNGTSVQCRVFTEGSGDHSDNATLLIQGLPLAIGNLTGINNDNTATISWTAPFSLDVTGVDPDIWYCLVIYSTMTDDNSFVNELNISETNFSLTSEYLHVCSVYIVSVTPFNRVGEGEPSNITVSAISEPDNVTASFDGIAISFKVKSVEASINCFLHGVSMADLRDQYYNGNDFVTYILSPNKIYSVYFEVSTTLGAVNNSLYVISAFDVQALSVEERGDGVGVTANFMTDTQASGCLVVWQGPPTTADIFQILPRHGQETTVSYNITIPSGMYTIYSYDVESNQFPNAQPSVELVNMTVIHSGSISSLQKSLILNGADILIKGRSSVNINCEFNGPPESSCVLVYREYGNSQLTVLEFSQIIDFPVAISVDNPQNYTFALFGKHSSFGMESEPFITVMLTESTPDKEDETEEEVKETEIPQLVITIISTSIAFISGLGCCLMLLVLRKVRQCLTKKKRDKQEPTMTAVAKNVIYEEMDLLSPTPPSISTEPNTAYAITTAISTT